MTYNPITDPVDHVILASRKSPGIAEIVGASSTRRWDKRKGFALSGARLVYKGTDLSPFTIKLRLYTSEDFADWGQWRQILERAPAGERARAQDIFHPELEDLGINSAVVEKVGQANQTKPGEWTIEIRMIEYRPPVRVVEISDGSEETPAPLTQRQLVIEALTGQLEARGQILRELQGR